MIRPIAAQTENQNWLFQLLHWLWPASYSATANEFAISRARLGNSPLERPPLDRDREWLKAPNQDCDPDCSAEPNTLSDQFPARFDDATTNLPSKRSFSRIERANSTKFGMLPRSWWSIETAHSGGWPFGVSALEAPNAGQRTVEHLTRVLWTCSPELSIGLRWILVPRIAFRVVRAVVPRYAFRSDSGEWVSIMR